MRVNVSYVQRCKATAHVVQVLLTFIAGCLTLAIMTKDGPTGGATKFYFALCFLTAPAIIYLVMVPMWSRAERFANVYAFVAIDALFTLLWFSAFIAVAMWNAKGIKEGAEEQKKIRNCDAFKFGSVGKCRLSRVTVGFGAMIFIAFFITAAISGYYLRTFLKTGNLPYESNKQNPHHATGDMGKDNAWSTEIEPHRNSHDSDDDDRRTEHGGNQQEDEYALLHSTETDEGRHPGRPLSWGEDNRRHTGYAAYDDGHNALSPGGYEEYRRDAGAAGLQHQRSESSFGGQGYSFSGGPGAR
ncbi:hypothetical protein K458DRAFT_108570 [Lentithecium fluviatile CBS 122367]|uniref:MARVEL domain-containing protein n=1 Tax=Lentithecium fluviatile CBS 122367 TaxID=1168545 RepID=A0A6G1IPY1_9PLEO|nr:hypothetical protein K458DRAFT_108570 [Lentithecium fluviatile CBS 122367]